MLCRTKFFFYNLRNIVDVEAKADNTKQAGTASVVSDKTILNVMKNCVKNAFRESF